MVGGSLRKMELEAKSQRALCRGGLLARKMMIGICCLLLASCASNRMAPEQRMERAQTRVFDASYDEVFPAVVEVLSRDYTLVRVDREEGAVETAPKSDVVLNTEGFQGVYSLKVRAVVTRLGAGRTKVRLRVLAGRLLDFVENRWVYKDFGTSQYYREYFRVIDAVFRDKKGLAKGAVQ